MTRLTFEVTRDVTKVECPWLDADVAKGTIVHDYLGCTYGCISWNGHAVLLEPGGPFVELPSEALSATVSS